MEKRESAEFSEETLRSAALEARREYQRQWRKANPEKVREIQMRYWMRKAEKAMREEEITNEKNGNGK